MHRVTSRLQRWLDNMIPNLNWFCNVISETEAYFEAKDKSFYKKDTEVLEKRRNQCITLEGDYVDK